MWSVMEPSSIPPATILPRPPPSTPPMAPLRPPSTPMPATQPRAPAVPVARGVGSSSSSAGSGGGGGSWMRWPELLVPAEGRVRCLTGRSGRVLAVGRHRDQYFAIDARCYHMGNLLCATIDPADGQPIGDIEDDGAVVCPAHSARIHLADGHVQGRGRAQRTLEVRCVRDGTEGLRLEVYVEPLDGRFESDNYNTGEPLSACRARARKHAMARTVPRRLIELDDDPEDVPMADAAATASPSRDSLEGTAQGIVPMES